MRASERPGQADDLVIREAFEPEAPVLVVDGSSRLCGVAPKTCPRCQHCDKRRLRGSATTAA